MKSLTVLFIFSLIITSCNVQRSNIPVGPGSDLIKPTPYHLKDEGTAPELTNEIWLNSETPLRIADLRGKVILLEMWTFSCINCVNTIPTLKTWYEQYSDLGLVIIGNHFPEFDYEADFDHLKQAVKNLGIQYPIAQDNEGKTWKAYNNYYWPTMYLIDKEGHLRYQHIGEGAYDETEAAIQSLLAETYP